MNRVLIFDVNETLLDIESLTPVFEEIYSEPTAMREWFAQLVLYSMTLTLANRYVDFVTLGRAVAEMLAEIRGVTVTETQLDRLGAAMSTMPAHPDVDDGLQSLRDRGFRLVTLTNSPTNPDRPSPLDNAGLGRHFERQFSVDPRRAFKPAPEVYLQVCRELGVAPEECVMVAAHVWDTIGAQAVGMRGALITRPGNAALPATDALLPDVIATDLRDLARRLGDA